MYIEITSNHPYLSLWYPLLDTELDDDSGVEGELGEMGGLAPILNPSNRSAIRNEGEGSNRRPWTTTYFIISDIKWNVLLYLLRLPHLLPHFSLLHSFFHSTIHSLSLIDHESFETREHPEQSDETEIIFINSHYDPSILTCNNFSGVGLFFGFFVRHWRMKSWKLADHLYFSFRAGDLYEDFVIRYNTWNYDSME